MPPKRKAAKAKPESGPTKKSKTAQDPSGRSTEDLITELEEAVNTASKKAIFACGGTIPIHVERPGVGAVSLGDAGEVAALASTAIALRWDAPEKTVQASGPKAGGRAGRSKKQVAEDVVSAPGKLIFPVAASGDKDLESLVADCVPATFGRGNKDVLDSGYRHAGKMDPEYFSTTFNPYDLGIMDTMTQMLLPFFETGERSFISRGVRAELYKLNIYSGPSGLFKSHVDTPRSALQIGSLVVCLPAPHKGGQLVVRHKGSEVIFDWGTTRSAKGFQSVQWAAFYSDCEHEVLNVEAGHRVTLTYNLHITLGTGHLTGGPSALDTTQLPLYQLMKRVFADTKFIEEGGLIGFICAHAYPHTNKNHSVFPDMLKGVDMAIWETLSKLKLSTDINSVIIPNIYDAGYWQDEQRENRADGDGNMNVNADDSSGAGYLKEGDRPPFAWISKNLSLELDSNEYEEWRDPYDRRAKHGSGPDFSKIRWLTPVPGIKRAWYRPGAGDTAELQHVHATYGNEARAEWAYSHCAIIAHVPAGKERASAMRIKTRS